jgi:plasmid stability protein
VDKLARKGATLYVRDLPEDLVRRAKVLAAQRGVTLRDVVADALRQSVQAASSPPASVPEDLEDDIAWYEANREELLQEYPGEFLAIVGREVVDHDPDFSSLASRTLQRFDRPVLMPDTKREQRTVHLRTPQVSGD